MYRSVRVARLSVFRQATEFGDGVRRLDTAGNVCQERHAVCFIERVSPQGRIIEGLVGDCGKEFFTHRQMTKGCQLILMVSAGGSVSSQSGWRGRIRGVRVQGAGIHLP